MGKHITAKLCQGQGIDQHLPPVPGLELKHQHHHLLLEGRQVPLGLVQDVEAVQTHGTIPITLLYSNSGQH